MYTKGSVEVRVDGIGVKQTDLDAYHRLRWLENDRHRWIA